MDSILLIIFISLALVSVLNIVLKKLSVSHIIGYIVTGTIISSLFNFSDSENLASLDLIGEFGIVFLMFTIGLELSFNKLKKIHQLLNLFILRHNIAVHYSLSLLLLIVHIK